jgi:hypothetical protein
MAEYGLSPDQLVAKNFRVLQSSRRGYWPYGKRDWIAAVKKVHQTEGNVSAKHLQWNHAYLYNQGTWIFGDWDKALRAAGFDPERIRIRKFWDKDEIISGIQALRARKQPLYANFVMKNHHRLFSAAQRQFGPWRRALLAAGITNKRNERLVYTSPLALLRALRDALDKHSTNDLPKPLVREAALYFGSLRKALAALKKDQGSLVP